MKNTALLLFFLTALTVSAQQSVLNGTVTVFNSQFETGKKQYVVHAQVEEDYGKSQAATTNTEGVFKLVFVGINDLDKVFFNVKKANYEVVNTDALQAVAGQNEAAQVYLALEGVIAENKRTYYQINRTASEKAVTEKLVQLGQQIETLQQNKEANKIKIETLQAEYGRLQESFKKIDETARELAERYAKTNLDDASAEYQRAFRYFQRGLLDSALFVFQKMDLEQTAQFVVSEQNRTAALKTEYETRNTEKNKQKMKTTEALQFKAKLHQTQFEFSRVEECYDLLLRLDSMNINTLWDYAFFLDKQRQDKKAIALYEKALLIPKEDELKAIFQNNLAILYDHNKKMPQAEDAYTGALKIYRQLANKKPDVFLPDVAMTLNNFGTYYHNNQKMPQAEDAYTEALKMYRQLADKKPDAFSSAVAMTLNNLGAYYNDNQKMPQAEDAYNEALKMYRQLADKKPNAFSSYVAMTLNNLGLFYRDNQKMSQAEEVSVEALKIYRQLAAKNPDAFLPDMAMTLNNLGLIYRANQKMPQAEDAYTEALKVHRQLAAKNPDAFLSDVATNLNNLGVFYNDNQKMPQAEGVYKEALKIYQELVVKNPDAFLSDVAMTLNNLGMFYKTLKQYDKALQSYGEAMSIQEPIILRGGIHQFSKWATILGNISEVKDSAQTKKDYENMVRAAQLFAEGSDKLIGVDEGLLPLAVNEYDTLSWLALFTKDYALAEKAARRCFELDKTQEYVLSKLGHSQLLRGQYAVAKSTYAQLKGKKDSEGKDYKEVILNDFKDLEAEGITHKDMPRMTAEIEKW